MGEMYVCPRCPKTGPSCYHYGEREETIPVVPSTQLTDLQAAARELHDAVKPMLGTMNFYFGPQARTSVGLDKKAAYKQIVAALSALRSLLPPEKP